MRLFLVFLLLSTLFLTAGSFAIGQAQNPTQNVYALEIQGLAWNKSTLRILLTPPQNNESWWNPIYANSTLRAIGQWNDAIKYFSSNYADYTYLSNLKLESTVSTYNEPGFDIYINWTQSNLGSLDEIGLATLTSKSNAIIGCTISFSTHTHHGAPLIDGDMQNIALHELGHALGLGHSNDTRDVMFPDIALLGSSKSISSLDAYSVTTTFAWMTNQFKFYPVSDWLQGVPVVLPANIQYSYLPVSSQNARPNTLQNNTVFQNLILFFEFLLHPIILAPILALIIFGIVIVLTARLRNRRVPKAGS